jgi:photosystem II stability/assembly factor-like uncharacterized protein
MKLLLSLLAMSFTAVSMGQVPDLSKFKKMKARSIGPAGMSGRVTAVDALHADPKMIVLGTASGGVWKSENGGTSWEPVFDDQPILNIGAVAIQQSNPSVIWAGTGEGNPRNSINLGGGLYKSLDRGKTWKLVGLEKTRNIHRILIDPTNPNTVYVGAIGNPYAEHPERGVYKTTDGGETWNRILYTNDTSGCAELVMDPTNPNKLLANMWQHRRTPWSFHSGGPGSGFYLTVDGGKNWKKLGKAEGLPEGNLGRIGITISGNQPDRIYAMVEAATNGLYRSDDGGYKWELINSDPSVVTNRPFYFQDIRVDPKNENRLYNINQVITVSEDGGRTFSTVLPYSGIHPDHHAFWINPLNPDHIIDGNDGGIGITFDRGRKWKFDDQIPVGQFYHINVDDQIPYNVMGGMQDNGSWHGPAYVWENGGIRNFNWQSVGSGDGFDVVPDPQDPDWVYAMSQGGELSRYNIKSGESWYIPPPPPDLETRLRYNWNAALALDPFDPSTVYYGSQFVHRSRNKGLSWEIISPDLTTNNKEQQKQDENGGLSLDITGAETYNTILAIAPSTKDRNVIWVGTDDGLVQLTRDGGKTWTRFSNFPGAKKGAWIPQIQASRYNAAEAFVVANDYRRGDFGAYIFRTTDYGKTWQRMVDDKKVKGYALCVIQDPVQPNLIFAGTEHGLWVSFDNGNNFQQWKHGYPSVSTYDMVIQEREADLVIGTFGRAIYILDNIRPLRKLAEDKNAAQRVLTVFPSPNAYMSRNKYVRGYDWSSYGLFSGQNKPGGASITYLYNHLSDTSKKKNDTAFVRIYDASNRLVRTLRTKADTGYNRIAWNYDMTGVRQPNTAKPKPNDPEPTGMAVFPGKYKAVVTLAKYSDSTIIDVSADPRSPFPKDVYEARYKMWERLNKSATRLTELTDRLNDANETIAKVESQLKNVEGKDADSIRSMNKAMTDSIKAIREFIYGKPRPRQGTGRPYQLTAKEKLDDMNNSLFYKTKVPDAQETLQMEWVEKLVGIAVERANAFFTTRWRDYRRLVESRPTKLFDEYKPL